MQLVVSSPDTVVLPKTIMGACRTVGIAPVPKEVLDTHTASELEKHPCSIWWYHRTAYRLIAGFSSVATLIAFSLTALVWLDYDIGEYRMFPGWIAASSPRLILLSACTILVLIWMVKVNVASIKGPAKWYEDRYVRGFHKLPDAIYQLERKLSRSNSQIQFVVGTLKQDSIVLDPYLLAGMTNLFTGEFEYVCIGIWDGDKIIEIAGAE